MAMSSWLRLSRVTCSTLLVASTLAACDHGQSRPNGGVVPEEGDRSKNELVSLDESLIQSSLEGDELVVSIPVKRVRSGAVETTLKLELADLSAASIITKQDLKVTLASAENQRPITARVKLPKAYTEQADLVRFNLHIHDGTDDGLSVTRSAFATLPRYEVRLEGPKRLSAEKKVSYRVRAHDPKTFRPIASATVKLGLTRAGEKQRELTGKTDAHGDAFFEIALKDAGQYAAKAWADNAGTQASISESVEVESGSSRLLLTTDKPIYQPGQTVHLRALALEKGSNQPVADAPVRFEIQDGKGNKLFKRTLQSDAFGIASTELTLGTVVNLGTFQVHAVAGELDVQKTFEVSRYVLPKFAVDVDLDRPWYRASEVLTGRLDARYFFGKDVVAADVEIKGITLDVGQNLFGRVLGKTNAEGVFDFELALPDTLVGLPLEQGNALVALQVTVTDAAGQAVEKNVPVVVAAQEAQLVVVPEGTSLVPGVSNHLQLFVTDPAGAPVDKAEVTLSLGASSSTVTTDGFGQATVEVTPTDTGTQNVHARLTLPGGGRIERDFSFAAQDGEEHVLVRADRAVYEVGDTVSIDILTNDRSAVYVDWLHEGQAVDQRTLDVKDGKAHFEQAVDTTLAGNNRIEAYVVDTGGNMIRAGATLFVREGGTLNVQLTTDKASYEPGQPARLTFSVKDETGKPKVAALGVQIVDEAVFGLVDAKPGLLQTYFELDDAFAEPHYQIGAPGGSIAGLIFDETRADDAKKKEAAQKRARATFAALGDMGVTGIHSGSWTATIARVGELLTPLYETEAARLKKRVIATLSAGMEALSDQGCSKDELWCDAVQSSYADALLALAHDNLVAYDPWGSPYTQASADYRAVTLTSRGPDELPDTEDDKSIAIPISELGIIPLLLPQAGGVGEDGHQVDAPGFADAGASPSAPDESGSEQPRVRREFPETLYVNPALITDGSGTVKVEVPLADSITQWRVSSLANAQDGRLGGATSGITVFQDFFVDIGFPAELTRGDEISFPVALYNYLDEPQTVKVTLQGAAWYTALGETSASVEIPANAVKGISFPVRVNDVGSHTLSVQALGKARSDAVERVVRVVPDGKAFATAQSGSLGQGNLSLSVDYPANAVPGSDELALSIYPAFLSSVVSGMDSLLQEPYGCFEQTTSTTWPNVLVLRYMRDTKQVTPEIQAKAESYISAGYQRLLTFEHPGGGFSWFGTQDPAPFLSVTAFGVMEFADMKAVYDVDEAMLQRTIAWLVSQQQADGSFKGDTTEFFSFNTSTLRNTAFVVWALSSAGYSGSELHGALGYLRSNWNAEKQDAYTLAMVANAFAAAAPGDSALDAVFQALDAFKQVDGDKISWSAGDTQTEFYGAGADANVTTTALVAHAFLLTSSHPELVKGAIESLSASRDSQGNFGSTQATIWALRTLLLAAKAGDKGAVGILTVSVDGSAGQTLQLTAEQSDVLTTFDLAELVGAGTHQVKVDFQGTGKVSYNLVSQYHVPWSQVPPDLSQPLAVSVSYDRTNLAVNDTVKASVKVNNLSGATANMILVDLGIPPGFSVETADLDAYLSQQTLSKYEVTPRQLILYITELAKAASLTYDYRLRASLPVKASDGGAKVYPYYEPDREAHAAATTLQAQ